MTVCLVLNLIILFPLNASATSETHNSKFTAVSAGLGFNVALKKDGTLWAWEENYYGQLGNGSNYNNPVPEKLTSIDKINNSRINNQLYH